MTIIQPPHKPYVPLKYDKTGKPGPPMTPLEVHRSRLILHGLRALTSEEEARLYPDEAPDKKTEE